MRNLIPTITLMIVLSSSAMCKAQSSGVEKVMKDQLEAFNARDIDGLINNVSEDFKWYYIDSDKIKVEVDGKESFSLAMTAYFNTISWVQSEITGSVVSGNHVSFEERVTWKDPEGKEHSQTSLGTYEIREGKIARVWYYLQ